MRRVQAALKAQLTRQNEKLEMILREKVIYLQICTLNNTRLQVSFFCPSQLETLKSLRTDRENMGIDLYGIQQQLARQQMLVEQEQDKQTAMSLRVKQKYEMLAQVRELYQNMQKQVEEERRRSKYITLAESILWSQLGSYSMLHAKPSENSKYRTASIGFTIIVLVVI